MKKILYTLILGTIVFASCKKDDPVPNETVSPLAPVTASSSPQFTGKLDGTSFSYTSGNFISFYSGGNIGMNPDPSTLNYSFELLNANFSPIVKISKGTLYVPDGGYPTNAAFGAFFQATNVSYDANLIDGVEVSLTDDLGVEWSTKNGTADQTGSTFQIVDRVAGTFNGDYQIKVKISLSCKLYDLSGNVKTLTEGIIVGSFANI